MHHRMEILNNFCINIPRRFLWLGTKEHCFKTMSVEIALINIHLVFRSCSVSSNEAKSSSEQSNTFLSELKYVCIVSWDGEEMLETRELTWAQAWQIFLSINRNRMSLRFCQNFCNCVSSSPLKMNYHDFCVAIKLKNKNENIKILILSQEVEMIWTWQFEVLSCFLINFPKWKNQILSIFGISPKVLYSNIENVSMHWPWL